MDHLHRDRDRGVLLVICGPSGVGKTSVMQAVIERHGGNLERVVTVTTRTPRPGERDGRDYWFISREDFRQTSERGGFLESATVHGHSYGVPREDVEATLAAGRDLVLVLDIQGMRALKRELPGALVSVFLLPPSRHALEDRLRARGDSEESVAVRMAAAGEELWGAGECGYRLVNRDLDRIVDTVAEILDDERTARLPRTPQPIWIPELTCILELEEDFPF